MTHRIRMRAQRIPPTRGLIVAHNRAGRPFSVIDLRRWLRLSRHAFKTDKIDILANGETVAVMADLLPTAAELGLRLSLRTDGVASPGPLKDFAQAGLLDVFLCPATQALEALQPWFDACRALELPLRLQFQAPFAPSESASAQADRLAHAGVVRVNLALSDPFLQRAGCNDGTEAASDLEYAQDLARELEARDIEANLVNMPFCLVREESWSRVAGQRQQAVDHAFYSEQAAAVAARLYEKSPMVAGKILRIFLSNATLKRQPADNILLPTLLHHHYFYLVARIYRRLTIHLRMLRGAPEEEPESHYDAAMDMQRFEKERTLTPACAACSLHRICDGESDEAHRILPGTTVQTVEGDTVSSPLHFAAVQPKYYDTLDLGRIENEDSCDELAEEARSVFIHRQPDILVGPHDYSVESTYFDRMESGLKWWSLSNREILSTPLGTFSTPLTISVDVGAGIADFIGFSLGRHCKIVCPMEGYRHNITLHINADGRYVLLRDGQPVRPSSFKGHYYLPLRLGSRIEPRISVFNIDECVATQNLRIWTGANPETETEHTKYSVIIVSTRFTRRLHAVLRSLAHQRDFDLKQIEVIVCYVPGIDATDDLIDSVTLAYPDIRFVRSPFPERYTNSKGFLINETAKIATGEWIMLLDSDTLLPPNYFAKIEAVSDTAEFIAPDGRKLLPKDVTARILMGEVHPWDTWSELIQGTGEFRYRETMGIPVGFCQTFRAKYLQKFPYLEEDHFEVADMRFGGELKKHLGEETRLSGTPVLHLDHGGSQWYGTQKHL